MVLVVVLELGLVGVLIVVLMVGVVGDVSKLWWLPCHLVVLVSVLVMVWVVLAMSSLVGVFFVVVLVVIVFAGGCLVVVAGGMWYNYSIGLSRASLVLGCAWSAPLSEV